MGVDELDGNRRPRRQERGRRRIESILDAAEQAIAEVGYDAVTTNLIAGRAGISPGSLYQFFANKSAIVEALAQRYVIDLAAALDGVFDGPTSALGVAALVDRVIDPIIAFNVTHPAAASLLAAGDVPAELAESTKALHGALCDRVEELLGGLASGKSDRDRHLSAVVSFQIFAALLPTIVAANRRERPRIIGELKAVLVTYWTSLALTDGRSPGDGERRDV